MGDVNAPGVYFVGRPEKYEEKPKDAADQPANTQGTPGDYFVGRPQHQQQQAQPAPAPLPSADQRRPGFLAKLFPCLAVSGAES